MEASEIKEVAQAIIDHGQATSQDSRQVLGDVAGGVLFVVRVERKLTLIFNSPSGL